MSVELQRRANILVTEPSLHSHGAWPYRKGLTFFHDGQIGPSSDEGKGPIGDSPLGTDVTFLLDLLLADLL
jgi:hypothetical protein